MPWRQALSRRPCPRALVVPCRHHLLCLPEGGEQQLGAVESSGPLEQRTGAPRTEACQAAQLFCEYSCVTSRATSRVTSCVTNRATSRVTSRATRQAAGAPARERVAYEVGNQPSLAQRKAAAVFTVQAAYGSIVGRPAAKLLPGAENFFLRSHEHRGPGCAHRQPSRAARLRAVVAGRRLASQRRERFFAA